MTNKELSVADFISKKVVKTVEPEQNKELERITFKNDVFNYQGVSLLATYTSLWKAVNEYDKNVTANNLTVEHYFNEIATFPFKDVADIFTDYLRKLVRNFIGLMYLPYTQAQANSVYNLRNIYPVAENDFKLIELMRKYIRALGEDINKLVSTTELVPNKPFGKYLDNLLNMVYDCPEQYLWVVKPELDTLLKQIEKLIVKDNRIETVKLYLNGKLKESKLNKDFDGQLVEDITNCLLYTHPHPEMYLALENAKKILSLYYTPVDAAKLFISNVEYKINRYLDLVYNKLDKQLLDWFRSPHHEKAEEQLTTQEKYKRFLTALDKYRATNTGLKLVLEYGNELRNLPYHEVSELAGFMENMKYVDYLNQSTQASDTLDVNMNKSTKPIVKESDTSIVTGTLYSDRLDMLNKQFKEVAVKLAEDVTTLTDKVVNMDKISASAKDTAQEALVKAESARNNLATTNSNLGALVDRVNIVDNKLLVTNNTLKAQNDKIVGLQDKTEVLDHIEEVKNFEGITTFKVFGKHA